jgi:glycosyltransferase involved in cell wall biosynthesis
LNNPVKDNKSFVWFSGHGATYKGLDLVIEAVASADGKFRLDICGNIKHEKDFLKVYEKEIFNNRNIKYHGLINPNSAVMEQICRQSTFVILPSCSEGGASSVITCMAKGLIPVVNKEASIDLNGFGIEICDQSPEGVRIAMEKAVKLSNAEVGLQQQMATQHVAQHHAPISFRNKFEEAIQLILGNN